MSTSNPAAASGRQPAQPWWRLPAALWWRSLPLRVIASVLGASLVVLVLSGFLLMQQATTGVMKSKQEAARNEARQAVDRAQQTLNSANLSGDTSDVYQLLYDLAGSFANRSGGANQYEVVLLGRGATFTADDGVGGQHPAGPAQAGRAEHRPADHPDRGALQHRATRPSRAWPPAPR